MRHSRPTFEYKPKPPKKPDPGKEPRVRTVPKVKKPDEGLKKGAPRPKGAEKRKDDRIGEVTKVPKAAPPDEIPDTEGEGPEEDPEGEDPPDDNSGNDHGDDDHPDIIVYCHCCGLPWWHCHWCRYWTPMHWCYHGYDHHYWHSCWYPKRWGTYFVDYHYHYDFVDTFPNIYTLPALTFEPESLAIQYLDEGAELFRKGDYLGALYKFRMAVLVDPDFGIPRFAYAQALFALGIYEYAANEIIQGLRLMPEWIEIGGDIKLMYGDELDFEKQLADLKAYLEEWPNDENALLVLGYVAFFSGDLYQADEVFQILSTSLSDTNQFVAQQFLVEIVSIKEQLEAAEPDSETLDEE
jgi:hypothetical protein